MDVAGTQLVVIAASVIKAMIMMITESNALVSSYSSIDQSKKSIISFILCFSDIDECSITTNNVCGNGVCKNIPGDFICECNEGFRTMAPMQVCMGI